MDISANPQSSLLMCTGVVNIPDILFTVLLGIAIQDPRMHRLSAQSSALFLTVLFTCSILSSLVFNTLKFACRQHI